MRRVLLIAALSATPAFVQAQHPSDAPFWSLIDSSRVGAPLCAQEATAIETRLRTRDTTAIVAFDRAWRRQLARAYTWDLWAVAYIAQGGCSDDCFEYFRAWLIGQGRERFTAAMRNPPEAVQPFPRGTDFECEDLLYVAANAYRARTGRELPRSSVGARSQPAGSPWSEDALPKKYPDLVRRFGPP